MSKRVGSWLNICLGSLIILVSGCQPGADLKYNQGMTTSTAQKNAHLVNGTQAVTKPYTGNIELKLDTDLLKGYKGPHKVVPFSSFSTQSKAGFKTQDLEAGPQVWQSELLTRTTGKPDEFDLTFSAPVGTYFLRVHNGDEQTDHRISSATVSLNGAAVSVPDDYSQEVALVQKTVEVTTAGTQQVHVRLASKPGSFLRLEVLKTYDPFEPVFDPADPSSLGDLYPDVPGNNPDAVIPETNTSAVGLNNQPSEVVATGQISVSPINESALQTILTRYNSQVLGEPVGGFYMIQLDMTKVDLSTLESNLRTLNMQSTDPQYIISSASFGTLESAKTFAAIAALKADNLIEGAGFNSILSTASEPIGPLKTREDLLTDSFDQQLVQENIVAGRPDAQHLWWLNEHSTRVTQAWNYTMGYNRTAQKPVRVAVIDSGFAGLGDAMQAGEDMNGQILWEEGRWILHGQKWQWKKQWTEQMFQDEERLCYWDGSQCLTGVVDTPDLINNPNFHGTNVTSAIVAKINNFKGSSGVAPHAKVIPFKIGNGAIYKWFELVDALSQVLALSVPIDVINMSLWNGLPKDYLNGWASSSEVKDSNYPLRLLIDDLTVRGTVIVACAGNGGWNINGNFPAGPTFPNIIAVGAIEDTNNTSANTPNDLTRAIFIPDNLLELNYASNWGENIHIWAPGKQVVLSGVPLNLIVRGGEYLCPDKVTNCDANINRYIMSLIAWKGTSVASPIVTGIVALLKSLEPGLTTSQVISRLRSTAMNKSYIDDKLRTNPILKTGAVCGGETGISCGTLFSDTVNLQITNAQAALAQNNAAQVAVPFVGSLSQNASHYELIRSDVLPSETLTLYWGGNSDYRELNTLAVEDLTVGTDQFIKVSDLNSGMTVQVDGWQIDNRLYFNRIRRVAPNPTPTATPPVSKNWTVKAFNVNDNVNVLVNGAPVINNLGFGQQQEINISNSLASYPSLNNIKFQVFNETNDTVGSAWGFEVRADGDIVYRDIRGKATAPGQHGARRNDPSLGLVYEQEITVFKNGVIYGTGDYEGRIYNTSDIGKIHNQSALVMQANESSPWFNTQIINGNIQASQVNDFLFEAFNNGGNYTWGFELWRPEQGLLTYRNRDGERENLDLGLSGANFNAITGCCAQTVLSNVFRVFIP